MEEVEYDQDRVQFRIWSETATSVRVQFHGQTGQILHLETRTTTNTIATATTTATLLSLLLSLSQMLQMLQLLSVVAVVTYIVGIL